MIGWRVLWKCFVAWRFGDFRHSSQPSALGIKIRQISESRLEPRDRNSDRIAETAATSRARKADPKRRANPLVGLINGTGPTALSPREAR
jgi:hypothetical protein